MNVREAPGRSSAGARQPHHAAAAGPTRPGWRWSWAGLWSQISEVALHFVDDRAAGAWRRLRRLLEPHPKIEVVGEAGDLSGALEILDTRPVDLAIFLDIHLPGESGLRARGAPRTSRARQVVFVTAYDEHAVRAFERLLDYLLKPVELSGWRSLLERARGPGRWRGAGRDPRDLPEVDSGLPHGALARRGLPAGPGRLHAGPVARRERESSSHARSGRGPIASPSTHTCASTGARSSAWSSWSASEPQRRGYGSRRLSCHLGLTSVPA